MKYSRSTVLVSLVIVPVCVSTGAIPVMILQRVCCDRTKYDEA
jgi:hypothetical protein